MTFDISGLRTAFERRFKERSTEITCSLLALLAGEHVLFLGPPGTAKSMLARSLCEIIDGNYFYYLLTRFTTPEEVFGPLSIKALQEDDFVRKTDGRLPEAHIAFLDEIFKANSSILNSFLTVLNERKFHNGRHAVDVPLISVFGASNELPEDEGLEALYDRFLFRCLVSPIQEETNFRDMLFGEAGELPTRPSLSIDTILQLQARAAGLPVDEDVQAAVIGVRRDLAARHISVTDRRWKKMIQVLKVAAAASGRASVDRSMLLLLRHMAWDRPEQRPEIKACLIDRVITGGESMAKMAEEIDDLYSFLSRSGDQPFPYAVRCFDCGEILRSLKLVSSHNKLYPDHLYYDPYRISLSLRYMPYDVLLVTLKEDYGWNFTEISPEQMQQSALDFESLSERYEDLKSGVIQDRGRLHSLLDSNVWVSSGDAAEVMDRFEAKARLIEQMGKMMSSIRAILGDNAGLFSRMAP